MRTRKRITRKRRNKRKLRGGNIKKIDNVAMLIPVHPSSYKYMYNLLKKMKENNIVIDIFLIFSSQSDYDAFEQKDRIKHIILEKSISDHNQHKHFQISAKRFYAYTQMAKQPYEYIISLDSEIDIIPENFTQDKIMSKIHATLSNKRVYGLTYGFGDIVYNCMNYVFQGTEYYDKVSEVTKGLTLNTWWTDLPVLKRTDITEFLSFIKYDKMHINGKDFVFSTGFDTMFYDMFLILKRGFHMIDVSSITSGLERDSLHTITKDTYKDIFTKLKLEKYVPGWIHNRTFHLDPAYFTSEGNFLIFHLDQKE